MQTARLSCCVSCFPGEVANKNTALYTDCLGLSFHPPTPPPRLKKWERTLEGGVFVNGVVSGKPHHLSHGANRAMNDCQLSAVRYWVGCSGSLPFLRPKVSLPATVGCLHDAALCYTHPIFHPKL